MSSGERTYDVLTESPKRGSSIAACTLSHLTSAEECEELSAVQFNWWHELEAENPGMMTAEVRLRS